jgi:hypothetical protein
MNLQTKEAKQAVKRYRRVTKSEKQVLTGHCTVSILAVLALVAASDEETQMEASTPKSMMKPESFQQMRARAWPFCGHCRRPEVKRSEVQLARPSLKGRLPIVHPQRRLTWI